MKRRDTWFTRQLEQAREFAKKLPQWALVEAELSNKNDDRVCDHCEEIWNLNSGEGFICDTCYRGWCCEWCANKDGLKVHDGYSNCKYCRLEAATDTELLDYVLHHTGWTRKSIFPGWYYDKAMGVKY